VLVFYGSEEKEDIYSLGYPEPTWWFLKVLLDRT